jgi:fluoroacetyl-CoA thioesterase
MPAVLATGYLVGLIEWTCMEALEPHLEPGEGTVGTMINISHTAATPVGMTVMITVKCLAVDGRRTTWEIEVKDEKDTVSRGKHERFTVNWDMFREKLKGKSPQH